MKVCKIVGAGNFLLCLLLVGQTGILYGQAGQSGADSSRKPNVVIIMADDLASNELGCYGG